MPQVYWWTKGPCRLIGTEEHAPTDRSAIWWQGKKRDQFVMKFKQILWALRKARDKIFYVKRMTKFIFVLNTSLFLTKSLGFVLEKHWNFVQNVKSEAKLVRLVYQIGFLPSLFSLITEASVFPYTELIVTYFH